MSPSLKALACLTTFIQVVAGASAETLPQEVERLDRELQELKGQAGLAAALARKIDQVGGDLEDLKQRIEILEQKIRARSPSQAELSSFQTDYWFNRYFLPSYQGSLMVISTKGYDRKGIDEKISALHQSNVEGRKFLTSSGNFRILFGTGLSSNLADQMIMFLEHLQEYAQKDPRQPSELPWEPGTYSY